MAEQSALCSWLEGPLCAWTLRRSRGPRRAPATDARPAAAVRPVGALRATLLPTVAAPPPPPPLLHATDRPAMVRGAVARFALGAVGGYYVTGVAAAAGVRAQAAELGSRLASGPFTATPSPPREADAAAASGAPRFDVRLAANEERGWHPALARWLALTGVEACVSQLPAAAARSLGWGQGGIDPFVHSLQGGPVPPPSSRTLSLTPCVVSYLRVSAASSPLVEPCLLSVPLPLALPPSSCRHPPRRE